MACAAAVWIPLPVCYLGPRSRGLSRVRGLSGDVNTMAATIQQIEGYYPGSLAYTNNNPGNLIYVGQAGATPGAGGFAKFASYDDGYNALVNQLNLDASRGYSITSEMAKYAPAGQGSNNPTSYANSIAAALGVSPDTSLQVAFGSPTSAPLPAGLSPDVAPDISGDVTTAGVDLSSLASLVPDLSQVDPLALAVGAVAVALLIYAVVK